MTISDPIAEALESAVPPSDASEDSAQEAEAAAEVERQPKPPEAEAQPAAPAPISIDDDEAFSDEKLSDPASLARARALIQDLRRKTHSKHLEMTRRESRHKKSVEETKALRGNLQAQLGILQNDLQALRTGDAQTVLAALSRVTGGRSGQDIFEEIALNLASNGKKQAKQPDPEVQSLRQELFSLRQELAQGATAHQHAQIQQNLAQEKAFIVQTVTSSEKHPILRAFAAQNPEGVAEDVAQYVFQQYQRGNPLDYETAMSHIETQLGSTLKLVATPAPQGEPGRETGAQAKPVAPHSGKTMAPSLATAPSASARAASEAELFEKAVQELPDDFWRQFS